MAHTFEYAILTAVPDQWRGERVNIGVVVFLDDRLDIRFSDFSKVAAIAGGGNWGEYADPHSPDDTAFCGAMVLIIV
jgi:hypothetical protein